MRPWFVLLAVCACAQTHALELAREGRAQAIVTLAAEATAAEAEAARELSRSCHRRELPATAGERRGR